MIGRFETNLFAFGPSRPRMGTQLEEPRASWFFHLFGHRSGDISGQLPIAAEVLGLSPCLGACSAESINFLTVLTMVIWDRNKYEK